MKRNPTAPARSTGQSIEVDYELLDALIAKKAKADVTNEFGATPLAEAVKVTDARMVKTLLDAGAGPEGANLDGETALMLAIKTGELPIVQMLIQAGANVNTVEKEHHQTPLMYAAAAKKNAGEMVKLLLSKGGDVKPRELVLRLANPDLGGASRAVSPLRGIDGLAVCGTRRLLRLRRGADREVAPT